MQKDSKENDPTLANAFVVADMKAERAVGNIPRDSNFIFDFWKIKKRILQQEFNIDWKSPAELNPNISYGNYGQPQITEAERAFIDSIVFKKIIGTDEKIVGAWRTFKGLVFVATREEESGEVRHYEFHGCEETLELVGIYKVHFCPSPG